MEGIQQLGTPSFRTQLNVCADYLLQRRNIENGAWSLVLGSRTGAASIVNTAEAAFIIRVSDRSLSDPAIIAQFLIRNVHKHAIDRGDNLRFVIFTIQGLLDLGYSPDDDCVTTLCRTIEERYTENEGWAEHPTEGVRLWCTFQSLLTLVQAYGVEYVERRYGGLVFRLIKEASQHRYAAFLPGSTEPSLSATAFTAQLANVFQPGSPDASSFQASTLRLLDQALNTRSVLEVESLPGTDWHHYSYCWALVACHSSPCLFSEEFIEVTDKAVHFINTLFQPGCGFVEPDRDVVNVRSLYNNVLALTMVQRGFDPYYYGRIKELSLNNRIKSIEKSVFLSFCYAEEDRELVSGLLEMLEHEGYKVITGEANRMGSLSKSILRKIGECEKFIVIMTKKDEIRDAKYTASSWLLEEKGAALAMSKPCLMMVEEGVDTTYIGGLQGDDQRLQFTRNNFASKVVAALRMLGR